MRSPAAFGIKGILKGVDAALLKFQEEANGVFKKYSVTERAPEPGVEVTGKSLEYALPCQVWEGKEVEARDAFEAFGERLAEIPGKKISPELLFESGSWSPRELEALEPLVSEPPLE